MVRLSEIIEGQEVVNLETKPDLVNNARTEETVIELGQVNLAFTKDEGEDTFDEVNLQETSTENLESISEHSSSTLHDECHNLPATSSDRRYSVRQECQFVKARRKHLKDLRECLNSKFTSNNGESNDGIKALSKIRVDIFIKLFRTEDVLEKLFQLFDYHQEGRLNQDTWIESLKSSLNRIADESAIGQNSNVAVQFVESIESVAYALYKDLDITLEQFCAIFRTKDVLNKFFALIDQDLDGVITAEQIMEFISQLGGAARSGSRLTKENITYLETLFKQYVGEDTEIRKEDFSKIIQTKNQFFTDRVFDIFDGDASGSISLQEFLDATRKFAGENPEDKILFLFKVYDIDGDGLIQEAELEKVMRACMEENGMKFSDEQIHELTKALFEDADVEGRGTLTYNALKAQLEKHDGLLENLSISIERWLVPPKPKPSKNDLSIATKLREMKPHVMSRRYVRNNYVFILWAIGLILANLSLFVTRLVIFSKNHPSASLYLVIARASGQCLNFDCVFIVVVMLRQSLTYLRSHGASSYIPIDKHIYFHKKTGQLIFFFSLLHTIMHLINIQVGFVHSSSNIYNNYTYQDFVFQPKTTESLGLIPGCSMYTGLVLMLILIIMVICSLPFVRRGGSFEVFYWTHLLYIPFWILLILHAPHFWIWFLVPGVIFIIEQAIRVFYWRVGKGKSYITGGIILSSKVTHLIIRRPAHFEFHPGDYVFIRIPKIAKYEWHPFTISSGPEQEDTLSLHIRAVGEWTNRLHDYFAQERNKLTELSLNSKPDAFFKMPVMNRKMVLQRRIEANHNAPNKMSLPKSISPLVSIDETTKRMQLKSVADSITTITPESGHSSTSITDQSNPDISSSGDIGNNNNSDSHINSAIIENEITAKVKKPPFSQPGTRNNKRPPLLSTKSMPDVHEKVRERERKMYVKEVIRSESVTDQISANNDEEDNPPLTTRINNRNKQHSFNAGRRDTSSALLSLRYMRNKPKIILLKTPKNEEESELKEELLKTRYKRSNSTPNGRLAEEGRSKVFVSFNRSISVNNETSKSNSSSSCSSNNINHENKKHEHYNDESNNSFDDLPATKDDSMATGQALEIYVDGPYGAPSSHIFRAQHAVLIATGIGVTPFASILQSIMRRYWASRNTCPNCTYTWCSELPQSVLNLRKVDFFWINRDQRSFEWFVHLLSQLEIEQAELGGAMERFLDMHMYITSALQRTDMKAVGLQLALDLLHEKEKRDLITGLKTRTNAGRPNWNKIFQQLKDQQKGKVTVFYCGPPELARTLKRKCDEFDFSFRKELF